MYPLDEPEPGPAEPYPAAGAILPPRPPLVTRDDEDDDEDDAPADRGDMDYQQAVEIEHQRRLNVKTVLSILAARSTDTDPSGRVQLALDLFAIATCQAGERLMRELAPEGPRWGDEAEEKAR